MASHVGRLPVPVISDGAARPGYLPQAFTHLALISAAYNLDRALG